MGLPNVRVCADFYLIRYVSLALVRQDTSDKSIKQEQQKYPDNERACVWLDSHHLHNTKAT